jgi:CheY-like chemotaxis protein
MPISEPFSVLVVDADPPTADTLAAVLGARGIAVQKAYSGTQALEILQDHPVDVLLTDLKMPDMNGVELYRKTRKLRPSITAILMTAYSEDELITQARAEGVKAFLDKPLDFHFLVTLISAIKRTTTNTQ